MILSSSYQGWSLLGDPEFNAEAQRRLCVFALNSGSPIRNPFRFKRYASSTTPGYLLGAFGGSARVALTPSFAATAPLFAAVLFAAVLFAATRTVAFGFGFGSSVAISSFR